MFKGPEKDIEFIYTAPSSAVCGVSLDVGGKKEYLIAAPDNHLSTSSP
uniref:TIMP metallopeptidase inhibitor 2 n=1 Tax=Homo sapiens TaxID=9606 RepID=A0A9L9PYH5_HUMAN